MKRQTIEHTSLLSLVLAGTILFGGVSQSWASIVVQNVNATSVTTSHLGSDTVELVKVIPDFGVEINSVNVSAGAFIESGFEGVGLEAPDFPFPDFPPDFFPELPPDPTLSPPIHEDLGATGSLRYSNVGIWQSGASSGLNYARFDLDADGLYETVFEFDFGASTSFSGDVISRYAYDDTGADLSISDAVIAFDSPVGALGGSPVPEPSTAMGLLFLLSISSILHRRRVSA